MQCVMFSTLSYSFLFSTEEEQTRGQLLNVLVKLKTHIKKSDQDVSKSLEKFKLLFAQAELGRILLQKQQKNFQHDANVIQNGEHANLHIKDEFQVREEGNKNEININERYDMESRIVAEPIFKSANLNKFDNTKEKLTDNIQDEGGKTIDKSFNKPETKQNTTLEQKKYKNKSVLNKQIDTNQPQLNQGEINKENDEFDQHSLFEVNKDDTLEGKKEILHAKDDGLTENGIKSYTSYQKQTILQRLINFLTTFLSKQKLLPEKYQNEFHATSDGLETKSNFENTDTLFNTPTESGGNEKSNPPQNKELSVPQTINIEEQQPCGKPRCPDAVKTNESQWKVIEENRAYVQQNKETTQDYQRNVPLETTLPKSKSTSELDQKKAAELEKAKGRLDSEILNKDADTMMSLLYDSLLEGEQSSQSQETQTDRVHKDEDRHVQQHENDKNKAESTYHETETLRRLNEEYKQMENKTSIGSETDSNKSSENSFGTSADSVSSTLLTEKYAHYIRSKFRKFIYKLTPNAAGLTNCESLENESQMDCKTVEQIKETKEAYPECNACKVTTVPFYFVLGVLGVLLYMK